MVKQHLYLKPNMPYMQSIVRDVKERGYAIRTRRSLFAAYGARRQGSTIKRDIIKEFRSNNLHADILGDHKSFPFDSKVKIVAANEHAFTLEKLFRHEASRISRLAIRSVLVQLPIASPIRNNETCNHVQDIFNSVLFDYLPVVDSKTMTFIGTVSKSDIPQSANSSKKIRAIVREQRMFELHEYVGELHDAVSASGVAIVSVDNAFHVVSMKDWIGLLWGLDRN